MTTVVIPEFREIQGGKLKLNFHPGQTKAWLSEKRIVCLQCGTQYGKTCLGPHWLDREMKRHGSGDFMAVSSTNPLTNRKLLPEMRLVFEQLLKWGEWKAADRMFESYARVHGAPYQRIVVGSGNKGESLESGTVKAAWLDEVGQHQFTRESWEAINRRLAIAQGRIFCTTTLYEFGWYKYELYDRWKNGDPDIDIIEGDSTDNPAFSREEYERAKTMLPSFKFNMFYRGKFEKPAGLIYDKFDEDVCVIDRFSINPDWPQYVGHDFGPNNTGAVWFAQDPGTGYLYMHRSYLEGGLSNHDHAQRWKKLSEGEDIRKRVGGAHAETGFREALTAAGWPTAEPRENGVEAGINLCYGWMQQNKLFVFRDQDRFLSELTSYSREMGEDYENTEKIENKSQFHLMDAMRYIISDFGPERADLNEKAPVYYHGQGNYGSQSSKLQRKQGQNPERKFWRELEA